MLKQFQTATTQSQTKKKTLQIILPIVLLIVLAIAVTIAFFTARTTAQNDFDIIASTSEPVVYAVYSSDDNSLRYYNNTDYDKVISIKDTTNKYNDLSVNDVYILGLETMPASDLSIDGEAYNDILVDSEAITTTIVDGTTVPRATWTVDHQDDIEIVSVEENITTASTAFWFTDLYNVSDIDISKLDNKDTPDNSDYMFDNCTGLQSITIGEDFAFGGDTPEEGSLPAEHWQARKDWYSPENTDNPYSIYSIDAVPDLVNETYDLTLPNEYAIYSAEEEDLSYYNNLEWRAAKRLQQMDEQYEERDIDDYYWGGSDRGNIDEMETAIAEEKEAGTLKTGEGVPIGDNEDKETDGYMTETYALPTDLTTYAVYSANVPLDLAEGDSFDFGKDKNGNAVEKDTYNTLVFYHNADYEQVKALEGVENATYNGLPVTEIYTGFDTERYGKTADVPWYDHLFDINAVHFEDTMSIRYMDHWFNISEKEGLWGSNSMTAYLSTCNYYESTTKQYYPKSHIFSITADDNAIIYGMESMNMTFYGNTQLVNLSLTKHINTLYCQDFTSCFSFCTKLKELDLSSMYVDYLNTNGSGRNGILWGVGYDAYAETYGYYIDYKTGQKIRFDNPENGKYCAVYANYIYDLGSGCEHGESFETRATGYSNTNHNSPLAGVYSTRSWEVQNKPTHSKMETLGYNNLSILDKNIQIDDYLYKKVPEPDEWVAWYDLDYTYNQSSATPWSDHASTINQVIIRDEFSPSYMDAWWNSCDACEYMDLTKLDMTDVVSGLYCWNGCDSLLTIDVGDKYKTLGSNVSSGAVPTSEWKSTADNKIYTQDTIPSEVATTLLRASMQAISASNTPGSSTLYFTRQYGIGYKVGDDYNGEQINSVYRNFEHGEYLPKGDETGDDYFPAWRTISNTVKRVVVVDEMSPYTMANWFYYFNNCVEFDLRNIKDTGIKSLKNLFVDCHSATTILLPEEDFGKYATSMLQTFCGCYKLEELILPKGFGSNATNMHALFTTCQSLTEITLPEGFGTKAQDVVGMFGGCSELETIYAYSTTNFTSITDNGITSSASLTPIQSGMFYGCDRLIGGNGTAYSTQNTLTRYKTVYGKFDAPNSPGYFTLKGDTNYVASYGNDTLVFGIADGGAPAEFTVGSTVKTLTKQYALGDSFLSPASLTANPAWYSDNAKFTSVYITVPIAPKSIYSWFYNTTKLTTINGLNNIDVSNTTRFDYAFANTKLANINLSSWKINKAFSTSGMFDSAKLTTIVLPSFRSDGTAVKSSNTSYMFRSCSSLSTLTGIQNWDLSDVASCEYMFYNTSNLIGALDLSKWNASPTNISYMFTSSAINCLDMSGINFTNLNTFYLTDVFKNCAFLNEITVNNSYYYFDDIGYGALPKGTWKSNTTNDEYFYRDVPMRVADTYVKQGGIYMLYNNSTLYMTYLSEPIAYKGAYWYNPDTYSNLSITNAWTGFDYNKDNSHNSTRVDYNNISCYNGVYIVGDVEVKGNNIDYWFSINNMYNLYGLENLKLSDNVTSARDLFYNAYNLSSIDISPLANSNLQDVSEMFYGCSSLQTITAIDEDGKSLDWTNKEGMTGNYMFYDCYSLTGSAGTRYTDNYIYGIEYAHGDFGSDNPGYFTHNDPMPAINMAFLMEDGRLLFSNSSERTYTSTEFEGEKYIEKYDNISLITGGQWYVPWIPYNNSTIANQIRTIEFLDDFELTDTSYWFYDLGNVTEIKGLSHIKSSTLYNTAYMFAYCGNLTELHLEGWTGEALTTTNNMFYYCNSLQTIYVSKDTNWNNGNVYNGQDMFANTYSLRGGNGTMCYSWYGIDYAKVDGLNGEPGFFTYVEPITLQYTAIYSDTDHSLTYYNREGEVTLGGTYNDKTVTKAYNMSNGTYQPWDSDNLCGQIEKIIIADKMQPTNMTTWFSVNNYSTSTEVTYEGLDKIDTSKCTNFGSTFAYATGEVPNLDSWDTSSAVSMMSMFSDCKWNRMPDAITTFDVSKVTSMQNIFWNCQNLAELNLYTWTNMDTNGGYGMMFGNCYSLKHIYIAPNTNWNLSPYAGASMFMNCYELNGFDSSEINADKAKMVSMGGYFEESPTIPSTIKQITYHLQNGRTKTFMVQQGKSYTIKETDSTDGYIFKGWSSIELNGDIDYPSGTTFTIADSMDLYSVAQEKVPGEKTISLYLDDTLLDTFTLGADSNEFTLPNVFAYTAPDGMRFTGKWTRYDNSYNSHDVVKVTNDASFYAEYVAIQQITLTFCDKDDTIIGVTQIPMGGHVTYEMLNEQYEKIQTKYADDKYVTSWGYGKFSPDYLFPISVSDLLNTDITLKPIESPSYDNWGGFPGSDCMVFHADATLDSTVILRSADYRTNSDYAEICLYASDYSTYMRALQRDGRKLVGYMIYDDNGNKIDDISTFMDENRAMHFQILNADAPCGLYHVCPIFEDYSADNATNSNISAAYNPTNGVLVIFNSFETGIQTDNEGKSQWFYPNVVNEDGSLTEYEVNAAPVWRNLAECSDEVDGIKVAPWIKYIRDNGTTPIKTVIILDYIAPDNMDGWFYGCNEIEQVLQGSKLLNAYASQNYTYLGSSIDAEKAGWRTE